MWSFLIPKNFHFCYIIVQLWAKWEWGFVSLPPSLLPSLPFICPNKIFIFVCRQARPYSCGQAYWTGCWDAWLRNSNKDCTVHPLILSNFLKLELCQQFHLFLNKTLFLKVAKVLCCTHRSYCYTLGKQQDLLLPPRQDHFCIGVVQKAIDFNTKCAGHRGCWLCV